MAVTVWECSPMIEHRKTDVCQVVTKHPSFCVVVLCLSLNRLYFADVTITSNGL